MGAELLRLVSAAGFLASGLPGEVRDGLATEDVSPGVIGFLVTLALVLACIPLFRSMTGKVRGVQHRDPAGDIGDAAPDGDEGRAGAGAGTGPRSDA